MLNNSKNTKAEKKKTKKKQKKKHFNPDDRQLNSLTTYGTIFYSED